MFKHGILWLLCRLGWPQSSYEKKQVKSSKTDSTHWTHLYDLSFSSSVFIWILLNFQTYVIPLWIFAHCNSQLFLTLLNSKQHFWSSSLTWFWAHILWYDSCGWPASPFNYFASFSLDDKHPKDNHSAVYILGFSIASAQYFYTKDCILWQPLYIIWTIDRDSRNIQSCIGRGRDMQFW